MNFVPEVTLEHLALVKVSAVLWNKRNIRNLIQISTLFPEYYHLVLDDPLLPFPSKRKWQKIEHKVTQKMSELIIPTTLKSKLFCYISPIGSQILKWMEYHVMFCSINLNLPKEFCWTPEGTIDKMKTAELLIKDRSVPIISRFKLACFYCLEHDVPKLWNELSYSEKIAFNYEAECNSLFYLDLLSQSEVLLFWKYYLQGGIDELHKLLRRSVNVIISPYQFAFTAAINSGDLSAVKYFFNKQNPGRRILVRTALYVAYACCGSNRDRSHAPEEYYTEVLYFLLSKMSSEEQEKVFKKCSCTLLMCCLDWPWQNFFLKTASHLWKFIPDTSYNTVLKSILLRIELGYKDYNYRKLFQDFWRQIPLVDRQFVMGDKSIVNLIGMLVYTEDKETIRLLFNDLSFTEKRKFIFSSKGVIICRLAKDSDKWDVLKLFIELCISSKSEMMEFKRKMSLYATQRIYVWEEDRVQNKWNIFLELLENCVIEYDERENGGGETSSAKRFCKEKTPEENKQTEE